MGCCHSANARPHSIPTADTKIFHAIKMNSLKRLESLLKYHLRSSSISIFDQIHFTQSDKVINPLGLCALLGNADMFQMLLKYGCSITTMEFLLLNQNISLMEIICVNGYLELLQVYFPYFLEANRSEPENDFSGFIFESKFQQKLTPIQLACQYGQVKIVKFFCDFYKNSTNKFVEFDVNAADEVSGENCAFVACRFGHLKLVKFLHEECQSDFFSLNNSRENTIMVTVAGMKKNMSYSFIDVVEYLIETVGVNLLYNYEEVLISAQVPCLVEYLEKKLLEMGVCVLKENFERTPAKSIRVLFQESLSGNETIFTNSFLKNVQETCRNSGLSEITFEPQSVESERFICDLLQNGLFK